MKTVYAINFYTNTICLVVSDFSLLYMYMISCVLSTMKLNEFFCYVMLCYYDCRRRLQLA